MAPMLNHGDDSLRTSRSSSSQCAVRLLNDTGLLRVILILGLLSSLGQAQFDSPPRSFSYGSIEKISLTPDERLFVTSGSDGIHIFDAVTLVDVAHLERTSGPWHRGAGLSFSPDSRLLAAPYLDATAVVWNLDTFSEEVVIEGHAEWVSALAFSQDGSLLATGDSEGRMKVWSTDTWQLLGERKNEHVRALVFRGTEQLIASNGFRTIRVWDLPDFERGPDFSHEDRVGQLVLLPDERRLLSGSSDGTVRLWDVVSGEALAVIDHTGSFTGSVILAPDGRHVFFSGGSSQFNLSKLWSLDPPTEIEDFTYPAPGRDRLQRRQ